MCDVAEMLWVANLGCIEFHPLHHAGADQTHPSYAFFDLDPMDGATWDDVQHVAALVKVVLDRFGIDSYPKTSGATGMQIMIPTGGKYDYDQVRGFVGTVSDIVHAADPETTTVEWEIKKRGPKVFLDVNMNREGANIACAYSVRPEPGGTVSTPFDWDELDDIHPIRLEHGDDLRTHRGGWGSVPSRCRGPVAGPRCRHERAGGQAAEGPAHPSLM